MPSIWVEDEEEFRAHYIISFISEMIGTATMVFIGCLGCFDLFGIGPVLPSFTFAMAILLSLQITGHFSPCHINPSVSLGFLIFGRMHWLRFIVYVVAQYVGAIAGYAILWGVTPPHDNLCLLHVKKGTVLQAFFMEFLGTMFLMLLVLGATDAKCKVYNDSKYLRIVLGVLGIIFAVEPFTGCGINPARSIPPAIFYNLWTDHWLYEVAPLCGSTFAVILYRFIFSTEEPYSLNTFLGERPISST